MIKSIKGLKKQLLFICSKVTCDNNFRASICCNNINEYFYRFDFSIKEMNEILNYINNLFVSFYVFRVITYNFSINKFVVSLNCYNSSGVIINENF